MPKPPTLRPMATPDDLEELMDSFLPLELPAPACPLEDDGYSPDLPIRMPARRQTRSVSFELSGFGSEREDLEGNGLDSPGSCDRELDSAKKAREDSPRAREKCRRSLSPLASSCSPVMRAMLQVSSTCSTRASSPGSDYCRRAKSAIAEGAVGVDLFAGGHLR